MKTIQKTLSRLAFPAIALVVMFVAAGCSDVKRAAIASAIEEQKAELPINAGNGVTVTDIQYEDGVATYICDILTDFWISEEYVNDERNLANVVATFGEDDYNLFQEARVGVVYVYNDDETGEHLGTITLTPEKMKDIKERADAGLIEPYTLVEMMGFSFENMEFPMDAGGGITITNAYMDGSKACYEVALPAGVPASLIKEQKQVMIESMAQALKMSMNGEKERIVAEDIHWVYFYKDSDGNDVMTVDISSADIFE